MSGECPPSLLKNRLARKVLASLGDNMGPQNNYVNVINIQSTIFEYTQSQISVAVANTEQH